MKNVPLYRAARVLALVWLVLTTLFASRTASAQSQEVQARALEKKAMDEDYLATEFASAAEKLKQALTLCGNDKCSPAMRAHLKRDVGVVQIIGLNKTKEGTQSFVEALKLDATTTLDADIKTPELEKAFAEAKKKAGTGGASAATATTGTPSGDFVHTPLKEQLVRTPIPIFVEYGGTDTLTRVLARYKGFGMTEWKLIELKKMQGGWGANVPCMDVIQGNFIYFVQGFAGDDPVAQGADRQNPYKVSVRSSVSGEPAHLPGEAPPAQCEDKGDCPPGFPCDKSGGSNSDLKDEGGLCEEGSVCKSGTCASGACTAPSAERTKFWIGASVGIDFVYLGDGKDVCKLDSNSDPSIFLHPINTQGYYCTNPDGTDYPARTDAGGKFSNDPNSKLTAGIHDSVSSTGTPFDSVGNLRLLLSFDYALNNHAMIGARLGVGLLGYPGAAAKDDGRTLLGPLHVEARFTYFFKKEALAEKGLSFYALGGVGIGQIDGSVSVDVKEDANPSLIQKTAWRSAGPGFVTVGAGARYAVTPKFAFLFAPVKLNFGFGSGPFGYSLAPEFALQLGL